MNDEYDHLDFDLSLDDFDLDLGPQFADTQDLQPIANPSRNHQVHDSYDSTSQQDMVSP
jgi:hypothetical protein